nr:hypothetical protein [uncultured Flavobacterium sp.]
MRTKVGSAELQQLSDNTINDFSDSGLFGNDLLYRFNDFYINAEYKYVIGKWVVVPGVSIHNYNRTTTQAVNRELKKWLPEIRFKSEYNFSNSEVLRLNYSYGNNFADPLQMTSRYTLSAYNTIYKGNDSTTVQKYHNVSLYYHKVDIYRGLTIFGTTVFNKNTSAYRNSSLLETVSVNNTLFLNRVDLFGQISRPETQGSVLGEIEKRLGKISVSGSFGFNFSTYYQELNSVIRKYNQTSDFTGVTLRTSHKKWPNIKLELRRSWGKISASETYSYNTDFARLSFNHNFSKRFFCDFDYSLTKNTMAGSSVQTFQNANMSMRYVVPKSAWSFEVTGTNILNNRSNVLNTFSEFSSSSQINYILPRIVMVGVSYKL